MKLTPRQKRRLAELCDFPDQLSPIAVEAFFAYTDRGDKCVRPVDPDAARDFDDLLTSHHHGVESRWWQDSLAEDFKHGLFFLDDFNDARPFVKAAALKVYASALGESQHWRDCKARWGTDRAKNH